jgi:hypothetical protein
MGFGMRVYRIAATPPQQTRPGGTNTFSVPGAEAQQGTAA